MSTSDEWIVGGGADSSAEYIVHLIEPRFIARFDDRADPDLSLDGGLSLSVNDTEYHSVQWLDGNPGLSDVQLLELFSKADDAITRYSFRDDQDEDDDC